MLDVASLDSDSLHLERLSRVFSPSIMSICTVACTKRTWETISSTQETDSDVKLIIIINNFNKRVFQLLLLNLKLHSGTFVEMSLHTSYTFYSHTSYFLRAKTSL